MSQATKITMKYPMARKPISHFFEHHPHCGVRGAVHFADAAHTGMVRKGIHTQPRAYITHPVAVARLLTRFHHDAAMLQAALLHDVVEDTDITARQIENVFGPDVAQLVVELTHVTTGSDGNRSVRKALDRAHLQRASPRAMTIKCMDTAHNLHNIVRSNPAFAPTYIAEKAESIAVLAAASDPRAFSFVKAVWERSNQELQVLLATRRQQDRPEALAA